MIKNTNTDYGHTAKLLHWLMAALFFGMFAVAYTMINLPKSSFILSLYDLHKATGILLFMLFAVRLGWRYINLQPELPSTLPRWQRLAAGANITLLYFLMLAMPLTGFLTSSLGGHHITFYHLIEIEPLANNKSYSVFFSTAHEWISYLLIGAFTMHVAGALYHHYILKDRVFKRIWIAE